MSRIGGFTARLYRGEVGYDFVGKRMIWYSISVLIAITAIVGLAVRGINESIDFKGGAVFTTPKTSVSVSQAETYAEVAAGHEAVVQKLGTGGLRIQVAGLDTSKSDEIKAALSKDMKIDAENINADLVGPSWGEQIANKAWEGLAIFMVLVVIYLAIAFEWRMALAALVALVHDLTITTGVYALVGFEVTPGTVIGLLTILGYSLYDTVVVFLFTKPLMTILARRRFFHDGHSWSGLDPKRLGAKPPLRRTRRPSGPAAGPVDPKEA
jgi:preprotein translocase subunit SecF